MTTPTPALTTVAPDGAYTIGGGEWNYGQNMTEAIGKSMFMLPDLTPENIGTILRLALERLPLDALKAFQPVLGLAEDLFLSVGTAVTAIVDNLIIKPTLMTLQAFNDWLNSTWKALNDGFNQWLIDWNQWLEDVFAPFNEATQTAVEDTSTVIYALNERAQELTGNTDVGFGPSQVSYLLKHIGAQTPTNNLVISPWFTEDICRRSLLGGVTGTYEQSFIGDLRVRKRFRINMNTTAYGGLLMLPTGGSGHTFNDGSGIDVKPGETYRMYAKVFFPSSNSSNVGAFIGVRIYDADGNVYDANVTSASNIKNSWFTIDGTITVPDDRQYTKMYPFLAYNAPAVSGDKMYIEEVSVVSETNKALSDAISVGSGFAADGAPPALAATRLNSVRSAAASASGASTTNANNLQTTWDKLSDGFNNTTGATGQTPTSVGTQAGVVRQSATGAAGNVQLTWNSLYDSFNGTSGSTGKTAAEVQTAATTVRSNLYGTIDGVSTGLGGLTGTGYTTAQAQKAAADTLDNINKMNLKIASLTAQQSTGAFSGNAVAVDFSTYSNSTAIGGGFGVQSGGGWGISNGKVVWQSGSGSSLAVYTALPTKQDLQRVSIVLSSSWGGVGGAGSTSTPANVIYGRMNASGSQYVYVKMQYQNTGTPGGCVISFGYQGGTIGTTKTWAVKAGATYMLECGTGSSGSALRTFTLYENGAVVHQVQDLSGLTSIGNYYTGIGATGSTSAQPCQLAAFSFYDNAPPTYKGSGFRACNFTSTGQAVAVTTAPFPVNYFVNSGTNTWSTSDYSFTGGTAGSPTTYNRLTVTKEGWYLVNIVQGSTGAGSGLGGTSGLVLYKNGSIHSKGPRTNYPANTTNTGASMQVMVYLMANDYIQPGYSSDWAHTAWNGDLSGQTTYFQVNFLGNTMPS